MTTAQAGPSLARRSKRFKAAAAGRDHGTLHSPEQAVDLVKQGATAKFDETVEVHICTTIDPKKQNQTLRAVLSLPHGLGKPSRVLVFAQGETAAAARQAGADYIGDDQVVQRIEREGWTEFDVAIATPDMMGRIGRLGRVLGRKGLMPNPRAGTVVQPQDLPNAVAEAKRGRLEARIDRTSIVHAPIGKSSFTAHQLLDNLAALLDAVSKARPEGVKGPLIRSLYLASTMGPSVKVDVAQATSLKVE